MTPAYSCGAKKDTPRSRGPRSEGALADQGTHSEGFLTTRALGSENTSISPSSEGLHGVLHSCFPYQLFSLEMNTFECCVFLCCLGKQLGQIES